MKTITINGWIHCKPASPWDSKAVDGLTFDFFQHEDMTSCGRAMVTPYTMEFGVPDNFNPNGQFVEALEAKKKEIQAEFQKRITDIQEEINKLTAISYEVTA
jgi:hypothetical protein